MRPIRTAISLTTSAVRTVLGLLERARGMVLGSDDEVWEEEAVAPATTTVEDAPTATVATAKPAAAEPATAKPAAAAEPAKPAATSDTTDGAEATSTVALKDRPSLAERLESVQGIGPAKREAILAVYGDEVALRSTDVATLAEIDGISMRLARTILAELG